MKVDQKVVYVEIWKNMALHLVYGKLNINFEKLSITNKVRSRFELDWVNLVFKPTLTLEVLCIMIITCIIL
jgi:hypothetical protein